MSRLIVEERVWFSTLGSALKSVLVRTPHCLPVTTACAIMCAICRIMK
jgi:hypothetical protein